MGGMFLFSKRAEWQETNKKALNNIFSILFSSPQSSSLLFSVFSDFFLEFFDNLCIRSKELKSAAVVEEVCAVKKETHYFVLDTDGTGENWKHAGELLCNSCLKHTVVTMEYSSADCCIPDKFWSHEYTIWSFKFVNGVIFWVAIKL